MLNAAKNFILGFLNIGLGLTILGYVALTFFFQGNWVVVLGILFVYALYAFWSASKANTYPNPDAAQRDLFGDLITTLSTFGLALTWVLLPHTCGAETARFGPYTTNLFFLWGMFGLSLIEMIASISFSYNQLFRQNPISRDPPG